MNETYIESIQTILVDQRSIAFLIGLVGVFFLDISIAAFFPFWLSPLVLGIIGGIIVGSARAGLFTGLGTLVGRFVSILLILLTIPGMLETLDFFLAAIGDVLETPLPPGSLVIILLSSVICGLFGLLGGFLGGSATKITKFLLKTEEVDT
ncbi:MAG: hypothetical protein ACFFFH_12595 [Candidatus Thorarchaeota archaeon]